MASYYTQDIGSVFQDRIGDSGLSTAAFEQSCGDAMAALERVRREHHDGAALMRHAFLDGDLSTIQDSAVAIADRATQVFLIGTGGSSLGTKMIGASSPSDDGRLSERIPSSTLMDVFENADPNALWLSKDDDVGDQAFIVVSKSGTTAETLAIFAQCWSLAVKALGEPDAALRFLFITGPQDSPLRRLASKHGITVIDHEPDVAGRLSLLTNVCLLPAAIEWIDGRDLRAGARAVAETALTVADVAACPPAVGAAVQVALMREKGITASVMMPYANQLEEFARWYCQLWAESLGKDGKGSMPYPARGMIDQHSQLQFWLNGPAMAAFTLIDLLPGDDPPVRIDDADLSWMNGRSLGQMMSAACQATADTLAEHGRPVRRLHLQASHVNAETMGALGMHFMLETVIAGYMLGIDPYTQPAVDTGKALMREYLSSSPAK